MKKLMALACVSIFALAAMATPIKYEYDARGRLLKADYGTTGKEHFTYDAANNVDLHMVLTDVRYMKSFMLYLSQLPAPTATCLALRDGLRCG